MKIRTVKLTPEFLVQLMQGKTAPFASNLPSDAELLDIKVDLFAKQVLAIVRSDSFEDVAETMPIPVFNLISTFDTKPPAKPVVAIKTEAKPETVVTKPLQENRYAAKMENEFSPEQRKLLSFTVKGDCVIAKPVTFLKAEWEDINEVVRSLGGKWVKGDIISYWEIPLE